ncbi:MAG TPA: NAD-glutamate dehydrogenase domain-containing protein [Vicinamibacteria bacterium]|nr:NAD-glutamate dehydrogenase domain-containing protein [Vicinamibacteria bacterium]
MLAHLQENADPDDQELLGSFARVVYDSLPEWMAYGISSVDLAERIRDNFRFFVKELPPPTQLYRGLPGLHVVVRHSQESESLHAVRGKQIPMDTTIVETHTPDAPFIFDSLKNYFRKAGLRVFSAIHPILTVRRQWERVVWIGDAHSEGDKELLCRFRIEHIESKERLRRIQHEIFSVLKCVFLALEDFDEMLSSGRALKRRVRSRRGTVLDLEPAQEFLEWLTAENFIFMGIVSYRIGTDGVPVRIPESALGVFRDETLLPVVFPGLMDGVERTLAPWTEDERIIDIDYTSDASAIYHLEPIDDIVVREWGEEGRLERATLLLGRFSQGSFAQRAADLPLLREKQRWLIAESGAAPMSYAYRQTRALFDKFPRRELFYASVAELKPFMDRIVQMTGDDEIAIHCRKARSYVALYVGFSRFRYSYQFESALKRAFSERFGRVSFAASEDAGSVQLLIFYFDSERLEHPVDEDEARRVTEEFITTWEDVVARALTNHFGEREGRRLFLRWVTHDTRSGIYRESTPPEEVPLDLERLEVLEARLEVAIVPRTAERATLKVYSPRALGFIETFATLRNLGLRVTGELHIPIQLPVGHRAHLYRYEIEDTAERIRALVSGIDRLADALRALDEERASDGALNALIVTTGLTWRQVEVLRTLRNHLQQIRPHYNLETVNGVILQNSRVAETLVKAFEARFDPTVSDRETVVADVQERLSAALDAVGNLMDDEVLRALANLIDATVRTNAYQRPERPVVAIKIDSGRVEGMPSPRPLYEIYVHSRRLEGIHLRGGRVARGGIRWSDRHDDFRTEILGLMKTQMVKNSIIVPVGSKGGFVLKGKLPPRPALDGYVIDRYREFISGLLDVTDNIVDGEVAHPPEVIRHDGDDPYLVVAADKGTAHLSDTANAVAKHYGFWLGDAFASGGSVGYDHKKVGITARGAWECIKHHFRNLDLDVSQDPFTVVGIGDMGGDVFGNGMLQSKKIRLLAAFNHLHIFVDPSPDPDVSYAQRERLFRLPRSSWRDYDTRCISTGGGIFDRSAKSIAVSPEMKSVLGIIEDRVSGEEMIRRILTSPVDLLYNGGIGTYVKASTETNVEVGDRANDRVRVDAENLRARVVGEGGNLGLTQKARLEYWANGGILNTDAVDNSGGVDMSDHEVNIKILLNLLVKKGEIANRSERDRIFMEMTEEVAELVLADNDAQALALTLDGLRSVERYEAFVDLVSKLVSSGVMDRAGNDVPSRTELLETTSRVRGLARPLLALVLGHVKIRAFSDVLESDFPESEEALPFLVEYFPMRLRTSFSSSFHSHPLRREIIATAAVNDLVNHAGAGFLSRVTEETGAFVGDVLKAYVGACRRAEAPKLRRAILTATGKAADQHRQLLELEDFLESATRTVLAGVGTHDEAHLDRLKSAIRE